MNVFTRDSAHFISCSFFYMAYNILKRKIKIVWKISCPQIYRWKNSWPDYTYHTTELWITRASYLKMGGVNTQQISMHYQMQVELFFLKVNRYKQTWTGKNTLWNRTEYKEKSYIQVCALQELGTKPKTVKSHTKKKNTAHRPPPTHQKQPHHRCGWNCDSELLSLHLIFSFIRIGESNILHTTFQLEYVNSTFYNQCFLYATLTLKRNLCMDPFSY